MSRTAIRSHSEAALGGRPRCGPLCNARARRPRALQLQGWVAVVRTEVEKGPGKNPKPSRPATASLASVHHDVRHQHAARRTDRALQRPHSGWCRLRSTSVHVVASGRGENSCEKSWIAPLCGKASVQRRSVERFHGGNAGPVAEAAAGSVASSSARTALYSSMRARSLSVGCESRLRSMFSALSASLTARAVASFAARAAASSRVSPSPDYSSSMKRAENSASVAL